MVSFWKGFSSDDRQLASKFEVTFYYPIRSLIEILYYGWSIDGGGLLGEWDFL